MKRVLFIRCGALGDLVYATSVIDAVRLEFGKDTVIDFVSTPSSGKLFEQDERVNKVFNLKYKKIPLFLSPDKKKIVNYSKKHPYDLVVNFEFGKQFKDLVFAIKAHKKVGAIIENISEDKTINRALMVKNFLKGIVRDEYLRVAVPKVATGSKEFIETKYNLLQDYIVISPSNSHVNRSGLNHRAWPNERWKELIEKLSKDISVVIVGTKNEQNFFKKLMPFPKNVINLVGKNNIFELSTVVKYSKAVICTDSAVGHISAAVNTPVFVLMGPNDIRVDSPYKTKDNQVYPISLELDCSPCYKSDVMKQCSDNICMSGIKVDDVVNKLKESGIL